MTERLSTITNESIQLGQNILADRWLNIVDENSVVPGINIPLAKKFIHQAQLTQQPLVFVAIGCQDWQKIDDKTWHIGKISLENKRARRFADEITQFQTSLTSLGVKSIINFSLSNVEVECPIAQTLDATIDNLDWARNNTVTSQENLATLLNQAGAKVNWFDHWQIFQSSNITAKTYAEFMTNLFHFDLNQTANVFVGSGQVGPMWLDCQSSNFNEVTNLFRQVAKHVNIPVLTPFNNAGNWHAKPSSKNIFPNTRELMTQLRLKPTENKSEWINKNLRLPDEIILAALNALGIINFSIDDNWGKRKQAIEVLALIAFNN